jgi:hypothetical protein
LKNFKIEKGGTVLFVENHERGNTKTGKFDRKEKMKKNVKVIWQINVREAKIKVRKVCEK